MTFMFMLIQLYQTFYSNRNKTCIFRTLQTKVFHFRAVVTDSIPLSALQNGEKYSQNTTIFIRYERVDHIAVYNYMFRSISAIVRLCYFML